MARFKKISASIVLFLFSILPVFAQHFEKLGSDTSSIKRKINISGQNAQKIDKELFHWIWDSPKQTLGEKLLISENELKIELRFYGNIDSLDRKKISIVVNEQTFPLSYFSNVTVNKSVLKAKIFLTKEGYNKIEIINEYARSEPLIVGFSKSSTRTDHAYFFPVTDYSNSWQPLPETLKECKAIAADLERFYRFKTIIEVNKTKDEIKEKLAELAKREYGPRDQLLLFFSMHGYFNEKSDVGCLVPYKALSDDRAYKTWLLHDELRALINQIPCQHVLVCLDACYSGTFSGSRSKPESPGNNCIEKVSFALSEPSRLFLTSGGKEKVPAASEFASLWRSALGSRGGEDGILTFPELLSKLNESAPSPRWGELKGHLGGGFVFVSKPNCE